MNLSINALVRIMWAFTIFTLIVCACLTLSAKNEIAWYNSGIAFGMVFMLLVPLMLFISDIVKNNGELSFNRLITICFCLVSLSLGKTFTLLNGTDPTFTYLITRLDIATEPFVIMYLLFFPTFLKNSKENDNA